MKTQIRDYAEMAKCKQKQWTSGKCKDEYCKDCEDKKDCYEVLGR